MDQTSNLRSGAVSAEPPATIRRFQHVEGFQDGTQWIEVTPEGSFIVYPGGRQRAPSYTLDACVERVARGIWKELAALRDEPERTDSERLRAQALEISELLRAAGVGPCTLPEGVRALILRAESRETPDTKEPEEKP